MIVHENFRYIAPEQVPAQYGGLSKEGEEEFTTAEPATEEIIKPASKHTIEFPVTEVCSNIYSHFSYINCVVVRFDRCKLKLLVRNLRLDAPV